MRFDLMLDRYPNLLDAFRIVAPLIHAGRPIPDAIKQAKPWIRDNILAADHHVVIAKLEDFAQAIRESEPPVEQMQME